MLNVNNKSEVNGSWKGDIAMAKVVAERRDRTREELKQLIDDRNKMLAMYCDLAGINGDISASKELDTDIDNQLLQEFCGNLIDYIARGHFELYSRIAEGKERRKNIIDLAEKVYPRIAMTTDIAVEFNDKYEESVKNPDAFAGFKKIMSKLGEELAIRFELEDQLINLLLAPKPRLAVS